MYTLYKNDHGSKTNVGLPDTGRNIYMLLIPISAIYFKRSLLKPVSLLVSGLLRMRCSLCCLCYAIIYTEMSLEIIHSSLVHGHTFLRSNRHCGLVKTEAGKSDLAKYARVNPLTAEINSICHLLALLAYHLLHVSRATVKQPFNVVEMKTPYYENMQNLCKCKGEEDLRWDNSTAESAYKSECEWRQTGAHTS